MKTFIQVLSIKEFRRKMMWMIGIIFLIRLISIIPIPGIDTTLFKSWLDSNSNAAINLFSSFTGGAFDNFSMFALGITPYITAQIILQLLATVIPSLAELQKKGEHGQKVTKKINTILAIILAILQSLCMGIAFNKAGYITINNKLGILLIVIFMTIGTCITVWLSELLTEHSIGQGVSIILMTNIITQMPGTIVNIYEETKNIGSNIPTSAYFTGIISIFCISIITIIYMSEGYTPIRIQYSQKSFMSGSYGTGMIPVKIGVANVMPIIFAASIISAPQLIASITGHGYNNKYTKFILNSLTQTNWCDKEHPLYTLGLFVYIALIIFFAYFYLQIAFNPAEMSENIRRQGGFIPGVRAGEETEFYIEKISKRVAAIGTIMLLCVTIIPIIIFGLLGITSIINSTSLIIVIGVMADTIQQIQLEMTGHNYKGILCE